MSSKVTVPCECRIDLALCAPYTCVPRFNNWQVMRNVLALVFLTPCISFRQGVGEWCLVDALCIPCYFSGALGGRGVASLNLF